MPADSTLHLSQTEPPPIVAADRALADEHIQQLRRLGLDREHRDVFAPLLRRLLRAIRNNDAESLRAAVHDVQQAMKKLSPAAESPPIAAQPPRAAPPQSARPADTGPPVRGGRPRGRFPWIFGRDRSFGPELPTPPPPPPPPSPRREAAPPPSRQRRSRGRALPDERVPAEGIDRPAPAADLLDGEIIERVPHIDINTEEPLRQGMSFEASVYLDTTAQRASEVANLFTAHAGVDDGTAMLIDVWLTASAHFAIKNKSTGEITLERRKAESTKARFQIEVVDAAPPDAGPPTLKAMFDHRMSASGSVKRTFAIDGNPESPTGSGASTLLLPAEAAEVDMLITIVRAPRSTDTYLVNTKTRLLGGLSVQDEWTLAGGAEDYVAALMADFIDGTMTNLGRQTTLRGAGLQFFLDAPQGFRDLYWRLVDAQSPPKSILLMSDERCVPWELMIPNGPNRDDGGDPLGVQCTIGRWYDDANVGPGEWIPLQDSLVLAPDYDSDRLPNAQAERDLVLKMFPGQPVPATFDELDRFYRENSASLLHFACHGEDATLQSIRLLNRQRLSAAQVRGGGLGVACRFKGPLVFLNACEVGRPGVGLASPSGFAAALIASKCGAVIAPLWQVDDTVAHTVAVAFYDEVTRSPHRPFADILRELRARAYAVDGADSYAAYCFYGHPLAAAANPNR
jgi:CHAT domain